MSEASDQEKPMTAVASNDGSITDSKTDKVKKVRTPAQLETLRLARERAVAVRAQNAEMRRKQAQIDKAAADEVKRQKVAQLEKEYSAITQASETATHDGGQAEMECEQKKKPTKKRVVVVEESSSEDEVEIRLPPPKRKPTTLAPNLKEERYKKLYNKMFAIE